MQELKVGIGTIISCICYVSLPYTPRKQSNSYQLSNLVYLTSFMVNNVTLPIHTSNSPRDLKLCVLYLHVEVRRFILIKSLQYNEENTKETPK